MFKKIIYLIAVFSVISVSGQSQPSKATHSVKGPKYTVSGFIKNIDNKTPIAYATVSVSDSIKPVNATYSDDNGAFKVDVPKGQYTLKVALLGYTGLDKVINVENKNIFLDTIYITEGIIAQEAVVIGQLITTDIDKTTYNTSADPEVSALTALEMMRKVPMLTVDGDDNLKLNGQANFKILVNGKSSTLMSSNYKDVLKSMPAGSIKNIEVITNPPAKYDAEGIGGIINIITDRKSIDGFNGSIGAGVRRFGSWNANAYIAAAVGKFSVSANYFIGEYNSPNAQQLVSRENFSSENMKYLDMSGVGNSTNLNNGFNVEASYEIDTSNLITLSAGGYFGNAKVEGVMENRYFNALHKPSVSFDNQTYVTQGYSSISASLDYQHSFKKKDETLTASYKFDYNANPSSYQNDIISILNYADTKEKSDNQSFSAEHTLQVDYFNPINKNHQIEFGGKFILRPNVSDSKHEYLLNDIWVINPDRRNDLDYNQYIGAIYGAYQYKIEKWSFKAGFRGEFTLNDGVFKLKEDQKMFNRYFNIIPYATIGFKPSDKDNLRVGYTQRLSRPGIWSLNPYWNDRDPLNITTGNPNLSPEIGHTIDVTYGRYDGIYNLNMRAAASIGDNSIETTYTKLENGALLAKPENIGKTQNYRLSINGGVRTIQGKLNFNLGANAGYSIIDANNGTGDHNEGWSADAYLNINSTPWKNGSVTAYGGYYYGGVGLQQQSSGAYYCGFSVGHWFLNKTLRVTANVSNPFTKYQYFTQVTMSDQFRQENTYRNFGQFFGISLQWRFGKSQTQVKRVSRTIVNDDVNKSSGTSQPSEGQ